MGLKYRKYIEGPDAVIDNYFSLNFRDLFRNNNEFREKLLKTYDLDPLDSFDDFAVNFLNEICEHLEKEHPSLLEFLDKYYPTIGRELPDGILFNYYPSILLPLIYGSSVAKKLDSGMDGFNFKRWFGEKKNLISTKPFNANTDDPDKIEMTYVSDFLLGVGESTELYNLTFISKTGIKVIITKLYKPEILNPFIKFNLKNLSIIPQFLLKVEKIRVNLVKVSEAVDGRRDILFILILYFHFKINTLNIDFINAFMRLMTIYGTNEETIKQSMKNLLNKSSQGDGNQIIISLYKDRFNVLEQDMNQIYELIKIYLIDKTPKIYHTEGKDEGHYWQGLIPVDHSTLKYFKDEERMKMKANYIDKAIEEFYGFLMGGSSEESEI